MSSHNIDENAMLKYVCFCFQVWGINHINKELLKKARQNSIEASKPITILLFHLCMLDIVDFNYTCTELGIKLEKESDQFVQQFVLSYFSEAGCSIIQLNTGDHSIDFSQSRILLLLAAWLMAKVQFFSQIKNKYINRKFSDLYIEKTASKKNHNVKPAPAYKKINERRQQESSESFDLIEKRYRKLTNLSFKIECLARKKTQIVARLSKQLIHYNKKNQTAMRLDHILDQSQTNQQQLQKQEDQLEIILAELIKGMKFQQYFWMWLQMKVVDSEFKFLESQFNEEFEKVDGVKQKEWVKMNANYLSMYNKQYNNMVKRMQEINNYMASIEQWVQSIKPPKNETSIVKEVNHDCEKLLREENKELLQKIGTPCFLKLEVIKYIQKHGFGSRSKKSKKKIEKSPNAGSQKQMQLKHEIQEFVNHLQQIKFI